MFTGLVVEMGKLISLERTGGSARLTLQTPSVGAAAQIGDSIAVNGCCLTVTVRDGERVSFDLLAETLRLTNLGALFPGTKVNLEPALSAGAKLGGHFVQGHVDGTGEVIAWEPHGQDYKLEVGVPAEMHRLIIPRGSITIDGISLTAAEIGKDSVTAWITPHTRAVTNLLSTKAGHRVNLEIDMLAKYVEQLLVLRGVIH